MGGATVQTNPVAKYEKTRDPRRMLTHKLLDEAIRNDWENIRGFLPVRAATYLEYQAGARKAQAWNEGEGKVTIDLPLQDGWYLPDGSPFAIPNGRQSSADNPDALYLYRHQDRSFSGPVGRGDLFIVYVRRNVGADDVWSYVSGWRWLAVLKSEALWELVTEGRWTLRPRRGLQFQQKDLLTLLILKPWCKELNN